MMTIIPQSGRALNWTLFLVARALILSHQKLNGPMATLFTQLSKQSLRAQEVSSESIVGNGREDEDGLNFLEDGQSVDVHPQ